MSEFTRLYPTQLLKLHLGNLDRLKYFRIFIDFTDNCVISAFNPYDHKHINCNGANLYLGSEKLIMRVLGYTLSVGGYILSALAKHFSSPEPKAHG